MSPSRRQFLQQTSALCLAATWSPTTRGAEPAAPQAAVTLPRGRVPVSFIIDDSTCLVNMGRFCMPQFATAWPDRDEYRRPWRSWPAEIPDDFVRRFGQWCAEQGVRGKYSIVPYPACVGWLDREIPGWSHAELQSSLKLVRELMMPNWDIHPEMITHTRVIDVKTGRPFVPISPATMENSFPQEKKSVDELAEYLAYALRILKNCDLHCDGITTPGGFGNLVKSELSLAVQQAVADVFAPPIPHYFKYVVDSDESTEPLIEHLDHSQVSDQRGPKLTVNVRAGTGDWFGGWDGAETCQADLYIDRSGQRGRMAELIQRRQPAIMLCHWPGMYCNGTEVGFREFQRVVQTIDQHYREQILWMKLSEIATYWVAKELAELTIDSESLIIDAPYDCPLCTIEIRGWPAGGRWAYQRPVDGTVSQQVLREVASPRDLSPGTYTLAEGVHTVCIDLVAKGQPRIIRTTST